MIIHLLLLGLAFLVLVKGADFLVEGASALASRWRISEIAIGLTIVAFGTSAPELTVNIFASLAGKNDIVVGNIIGSNLFNSFLILGTAGLILPLEVKKQTVWREIPFMLVSALVLLVITAVNLTAEDIDPAISLPGGLGLLLIFMLFMLMVFRLSKPEASHNITVTSRSLGTAVLLVISGLAALFIGGKLAVDKAVIIANMLGVSEKVIAVTVVAAGTSLPELVTSAVAAFKRKSDLAIGNIVGSNIFNIFFVLGICALINPVRLNQRFFIDLVWYTGGAAALFLWMFTGKRLRLDRWEAFLLVAAYLIYILLLLL